MHFLNEIWQFFQFTEPNVKVVFWGSLILCAVSGQIGTFTFLRKRSLIGDVISHSVLPGIALAFIIGQQKNPVYLLIGGTITGWISTYLVDFITKKTKLKPDAAIALVLSVFFGIGILMLTNIQHSGNAAQSGLDHFIFGRASAMNMQDVLLFASLGILMTLTVVVFFRGFTVLSFDEEFANSIGFPNEFLRLILSILTVITVTMGVQAVGVVLMSALLITPAATAKFWTNKVSSLTIIAVAASALSGVLGAAISYTSSGMPTGPWIVVVISVFAFASSLFGVQNGLLRKLLQRTINNRKILEENTIKPFYALSLDLPNLDQPIAMSSISASSNLSKPTLTKGLQRIKRKGLIVPVQNGYRLTQAGYNEAKAIVRKHRLWELYIAKFMHLAPDHVHDDAEGIEHVITPEIEKELEKELNFPTRDPHDSEIPY